MMLAKITLSSGSTNSESWVTHRAAWALGDMVRDKGIRE